jgi:hypothetical protein
MRRENERLKKQLDETVQYAYGEQGVTNYADFDTRRRAAEFQQQMSADPQKAIEESYKRMKENDPDFQQMRESNYRAALEKDAVVLSREIPESGIKTGDDLQAYLDGNTKMLDLLAKGVDIQAAYWALNHQELSKSRGDKREQETIAKLNANANATPGAVGQGGANEDAITFTDAQFNNPDQNRLVRDTRYYKAYMAELKRRTKG